MLPLPAATTTLSNLKDTSQPVFNAFIPYGYMEIGITVGALLVVFLIAVFWGGIKNLLSGMTGIHFGSPADHNRYYNAKTHAWNATSSSTIEQMKKNYAWISNKKNIGKLSRYD